MTHIQIRDESHFVKIIGKGNPIVLMHNGHGTDLHTFMSFIRMEDHWNLIFYDRYCDSRSTGSEITTMTMENLSTVASELHQALGIEKWVGLRQIFGSSVALEYALRYSQTFLILMNRAGKNPQDEEPSEVRQLIIDSLVDLDPGST